MFAFASKGRFMAIVALCGLAVSASAQTFPSTIALPAGWQPEGIAAGRGPVLYVGSLASGAIYAIDSRTGAGEVLSPGTTGMVAVGIEFDRRSNVLYVAGGATGQARVIDAASGAVLATFQLASSGFINDAAVTQDAVYFTNSLRQSSTGSPLDPVRACRHRLHATALSAL